MTGGREDIHSIADEYVLGLLDAGEAAAVDARIEHDPALRAAVAASRERFLPLDTQLAPADVDDVLWRRIEANLPARGDPAAIPQATPANDNRRSGWRMAALTSFAATLLLTAGLVWSLSRTVEPVVIAVLLNEAGVVQAVVEDFGNDTANVRLLNAFEVPADKTIQVWTLPSRELGPVSLGLLDGSRSARLEGPRLPNPNEDQLYELTLEQAGGSTSGRPTGPILAKGFAKMVH
ncbi:anti-sigma factor domain-containing protein [Shinella sp.]|uniref:anti-sigma factor n=1 Tax=Shinella sp. TaxID=1870904 RepID=UPI0029A526B7|nr:anti-sigma factor [Shinella sp.]MDX3977692.1 anti-sigma factor [Shinella sp.]